MFLSDHPDCPSALKTIGTIESINGFYIISIVSKERKSAVVGYGPGYDNTIWARYWQIKMEEVNPRVNLVACYMFCAENDELEDKDVRLALVQQIRFHRNSMLVTEDVSWMAYQPG